jgi:hypothetical protein
MSATRPDWRLSGHERFLADKVYAAEILADLKAAGLPVVKAEVYDGLIEIHFRRKRVLHIGAAMATTEGFQQAYEKHWQRTVRLPKAASA